MGSPDMDADVIAVEIPFRTVFSHAGARCKPYTAIVVRVRDADGLCGYGEGGASHDAGEGVDGAVAWLQARIGPWSANVRTLEDLQRLCEIHEAEIDSHPSAFCAFELAMLDYLARRAGVTIEAFLGLQGLSRPHAVSAMPGVDDPVSFHLQAWRFWTAGMTAAKLKAGKDAGRNRYRAGLLARFATVRLDGNHLWAGADEAIAALTPFKDKIWAVEEPVAARDFAAMMRIHKATGLTIILGESLVSGRDLDALLALDPDPNAFVVNLRISRLGGLLRTLKIARRLKAKGLGRIIGAQAGEGSCLTRAAMALAREAGPLIGFEAGYGKHLLTRDTFTPSLTFDRRGVLALSQFPLGPEGLGLTPSGLSFEAKGGPEPRQKERDDGETGRTWVVEEWVSPQNGGADASQDLPSSPMTDPDKTPDATGEVKDLRHRKHGIGLEV